MFARFEDVLLVSNQMFLDYTGFSKDEFSFILLQLNSLKNSPCRSKEQALDIFLTWLKTGLPQQTLATFSNIDMRQNIIDYCQQVRTSFEKDFLNQYLGSDHLSRNQWVDKNTVLVRELFNLKENELCIIADGTYTVGACKN